MKKLPWNLSSDILTPPHTEAHTDAPTRTHAYIYIYIYIYI